MSNQDTIVAIRNGFEGAVRMAGTLPDLKLPSSEPTNFVTGRPVVRDKEQLYALCVAAAAEGYSSNKWATMKQIRENGGTVPKNTFGAPMFMQFGDKLRYYRVYNYDTVSWGKEPAKEQAPKKAKKDNEAKRTTAPRKQKTSSVTVTMPDGTVITGTPDAIASIMSAMCR